MKFARLFTILLSVLTVLSLYQDKAPARPADRIGQADHTEVEESALLNTGTATLDEPDPDEPKPKPDPEPDPDPLPRPLPGPPYSS